jgi:hypothetical protein
MANHQTTVQAKTNGGELTLSQHSTDSPILPTAQLERLHSFRPDKVDWVFDQTQQEAEHRRTQDRRVNVFIFVERIVGQVFGLLVALAGLAAAAYMATHGAPTAGAVVGGTTLVSMVTAFIVGRTAGSKTSKPQEPPPEKTSKKR